jgi:hypothetical protein
MTVGISAMVVSGLTAVASGVAAKKAAKNQKRANATQAEINRLQNEQAKRSFIRNYRQQQAANINASIAAGIGLESSRTQGTRSSLESQRITAQVEFKEADRLGTQKIGQLNKAATNQFQSQAWGAASSFASSFVNFGTKKPDDVVKPKTPNKPTTTKGN